MEARALSASCRGIDLLGDDPWNRRIEDAVVIAESTRVQLGTGRDLAVHGVDDSDHADEALVAQDADDLRHVDVAVVVRPGAELLADPRREPGGRIGEPVGERLRLRALDPLVAGLLALPVLELVQVALLILARRVRRRAVAPGGEFYVADGYGNSRVVKFAKDGKVLANQEAKRALVKLPVKVVKNKVMVNVAGFI